MHELPECIVIVNQLKKEVLNKTISNVMVNSHPHKFAFYFDDPNRYYQLLMNKTIDDIKSYGSQIEFFLSDVRIVLWDGVNILYVPEGKKLPSKHQLLLSFSDGSNLVCSVQMYGGLWVFREGENDQAYYKIARERPSPLSKEFDFPYFESVFQNLKKSLSVKAFLATEQRFPGIGNGVLQDILFNSGIHPKRKIKTLTNEELKKLFRSIKTTLKNMVEDGGRNIEKDIYAQPGRYKTILSSKTKGMPCPICQSLIKKESYLGGSIYYCQQCQK